jgi:vacuolar-type H+-ATPase catalytic subunit A/Vma1
MAITPADSHNSGDPSDPGALPRDATRAVLTLFAELPARLRELEAGMDRERLDGVRDVARLVKETLHDSTSPELRAAAREILSTLDASRELAPLVALCRKAMEKHAHAPRPKSGPEAGPKEPNA